MHAPGEHRALEQVAAKLGEDPSAADLADAVPGAPDPLQPAGDRLRRLDLQHEVDRAHVDPELERGGRDEAWKLSGLEQLLDLRPLLARERAVVGAGDLARRGVRRLAAGPRPVAGGVPRVVSLRVLARGKLVQPQRDALGRAAVVDEHDRRVVLLYQPEQLGVDRRPDRSPRGLAAGDGLQWVLRRTGIRFGHRLDRDLDPQVELLFGTRVNDRDIAMRADEVAPDLLERILGRGEPDPLDPRRGAPAARLGLEPLEREREVRAALGGGNGVDLVDDHRLDRAERLSRARGEHQVERLRRRDQDVGRVA